MNNRNSLEGQVNEAVARCKSRKCEGCPFNGVSACCVTVLLHIQHATATFEKDGHHLRCSNCGEYFCSKDCEGNVFPQKYCPNCGAKMELTGSQEAVVRFKDCVNWDKGHLEECDNSDSVCFHNGWCKPDWFCADVERKES